VFSRRRVVVLKQISELLNRISNGWVALTALSIFLLFSALVLPKQSAQASAELGDIGSPDLSLLYSVDDLYQFADAYGDQGRAAYIRTRFSFDLVWPLVYTLFLSTALSWTMTKAPPTSLLRRINLVPLLGMLFDYLENLATSLVMARFPARTLIIDFLAPIFTLLKWGLISTSFVLLVLGLVQSVRRWTPTRRERL